MVVKAKNTKELAVSKISIDGGTQLRERIDTAVVNEYAERFIDGDQFPPVIVYYDGKHYWLADGFHRFHAAKKAGLGTLLCEVRQGTQEDAQWEAAAANKTHGLPRSNADKAAAVKAALLNPKAAGLSDRQIAEHCGVSHAYVGKLRKQEESTGNVSSQEMRTGRDGRITNTANIGKTQPKPDPSPATEPPVKILDDKGVQWLDTDDDPITDEDWEEAEEDSAGLKKAQAPFDALVRELGAFKAKADHLSKTAECGAWMDPIRLDEFQRRITNVQSVLKAVRPHAVCGYCKGKRCDKCRNTGYLPYAQSEAAPQLS